MAIMIYLGYEKRNYTNKAGEAVTGYNLFYAYPQDSVVGFKPAMRFDSARKSMGYCYLSSKAFEALNLNGIAPLSKVYITFNQFGVVDTISLAK